MASIHGRFAALVRLTPLTLVLVAGALAPVGWAESPPPDHVAGALLSPTPGTVFIEGPSYIIPIKWNASCQNRGEDELRYHHWSVAIHVTRTKGSPKGVVGTQSLEYVGVNDSSKGPREQGMVVTLAPGAQMETFEVKLWVVCYGVRTVIGTTSVTVALSKRPAAPPPATTTATPAPGATTGAAQRCVVPKLIGKTLVAARRAIVAAHCSVGPVRHAVSTRAKQGLVVSQTPAAGAKRARGAVVTLVVGGGPKR